MSWRTPADLAWLDGLRGVERDHPLARHTSFNIGGPAEWFVAAAAAADVVVECRRRGIPCLPLGAGTNLLVADAGVEGLVVRCVAREWRVDARRVFAEAGLKMLRLARICADHDLTGFEWAIGVPGTVGGAVYQNAGCWGGELVDVLVAAHGRRPDGAAAEWAPGELGLGYRTSALREGGLRGAVVTGATIELRPGDGAAARRQMARWTAERSRTQPIRTLNCGSVFRNPPGDSAGRLIEAAGLKGFRIGGAVVSEKHANFIVNDQKGTAADVRRVADHVRTVVAERTGIELVYEVEFVGDWDGWPWPE
jgi:UDP-N-acetylmuramate dehydrogenase